MAKLNYFSQIKIIGTETQHVRYPKVFAININHIALFQIILLVKQYKSNIYHIAFLLDHTSSETIHI